MSLGGSDLPFREVLSSYVDERKYLWLLVTNELCRISGSEKDCFEIPIKETNELFCVSNRYLIVHNRISNDAVYFDLQSYIFKKFNFTSTAKIYKNLKEDGNLYYHDKGIIYRYDFNQNKGIVHKKINYGFTDVKHKLYKSSKNEFLATELGYIWVNDKKIAVPLGESFSFQQIFESDEGYVYNDGRTISRLDPTSQQLNTLYTDSLICKVLWQDDKGNFILGMHKANLCQIMKSLNFYDKNWNKLLSPPSIGNIENKNFAAQIQSHDFTKEWNASIWNGFARYSKVEDIAQRLLYEPLNGRPFNHVVTDMAIDNENNIFIIAEEQKIFKLHKNGRVDTFNIKVFIKDKVKPMTLGKAIIFDEVKGLVYAGCGEYNTQHSSILQMNSDGKNAKTIFSLDDRIWDFLKEGRSLYIASTRNRVFRFDLDSHKMDTLVKLEDRDVHIKNILLVENTMYIGTREGLYTYDLVTKKQQKIEEIDGININKISQHDHKIYLSTMSGIYILDKSKKIIGRYTTKQGLPDDDVKGVMFFTKDEALIPTSKGVGKINFQNQLCYIYNNSKIDLSDDENNSMSQLQQKGHIYLGTINGLDLFNTQKLIEKNSILPFISKVTTYNNDRSEKIDYKIDKKIEFRPNDLKCIIHFGSKLNNKNVSYAVKNKGVDTNWTFISGQSLELLRPQSDIELVVKCTNEYGVWSDKEEIIEVVCFDHFYNNPIFYILLTALISGLVYYFSKKREEENTKNNNLIQDMQSKMAQSKLESLQAQMNPHFLFNAMASIQFLLKNNQIQKAEHMLTSFSKLIRKTLESSVKLVWPLEEEIAMLKLYCDIEKERFDNNNIIVKIHAEGIELEEVYIPPMLIQPFVENVFKHAFTDVELPRLDILFEEKEDTLLIEVRDNGIGLQASKRQNEEETKGPRGMLIAQDRIDLYSKKIGREIKFKIEEKNEKGKILGTSIFIAIPI